MKLVSGVNAERLDLPIRIRERLRVVVDDW